MNTVGKKILALALSIAIGPLEAGQAIAQSDQLPEFLGPQEPPFILSHPIAPVGGLLIDATGALPRLGYTVIIEGEKITKVGRSEDVIIPHGAQVIDTEGMTIMPGIINSNQHIQLNPPVPGAHS